LIAYFNVLFSVFEFTAPSDPDRHREIAEIFGGADEADAIRRLPDSDIGPLVHDRIASFLGDTLGMPRGLSAVGYKNEHSELG
jgi:hydroxyacid-oxoacid transhydrogenase